MARLSEIDFLHLLVLADGVRRFLDEDAAFMQAGDEIGEAKGKRHVVFDQNQRQIARQGFDNVGDDGAFCRRKTRCRLVEQQRGWLGDQGERDLELTLFAVGQILHRNIGAVMHLRGIQRLAQCGRFSASLVSGEPNNENFRGESPRTASTMLSCTDSVGNRLVIWKVREMPALRAGAAAVW